MTVHLPLVLWRHEDDTDADLTGVTAPARNRGLGGGGGLRVLLRLGSRMEAVRTLEPGRWWCRAAGFGEMQPAHAVLLNGLVASCFIHLPWRRPWWGLGG